MAVGQNNFEFKFSKLHKIILGIIISLFLYLTNEFIQDPSNFFQKSHLKLHKLHYDLTKFYEKKIKFFNSSGSKLLAQEDKRFTEEWADIQEYTTYPDMKTFSIQHLQFNYPFLCKGCLKHWDAIDKWQDDNYLKEKIGNIEIEVEKRNDGKNTFAYFQKEFKEEKMLYKDYLKVYQNQGKESTDRYYYANQKVPQTIQNDIKKPFLGEIMELYKTNIWQSAGGSESLPHTDAYDNFLCQVAGYKDIILLAPTQRQFIDLYESSIYSRKIQYTIQYVPNYSPVNFFNPDYSQHPNFQNVQGKMKIRLESGDMLFLPAFWWHHIVSSKERSIAINYWYLPNYLLQIFMGGLEQQDI